jgi:hypothetical protein
VTGDCHAGICGSRGLQRPRLPDPHGSVDAPVSVDRTQGRESTRAAALRSRAVIAALRRMRSRPSSGLDGPGIIGPCPIGGDQAVDPGHPELENAIAGRPGHGVAPRTSGRACATDTVNRAVRPL